ncbi:MAG: pimeloyl-ACP methyl ester carboxylesterase [Myxococcota bacterium]|jgi:pimeloyl-ACP methyl ester carboxylesterase
MHTPAPLWSEARLLREPFRLLWNLPALLSAPKGTGAVMVIPGFRTTDRSTVPLRKWLTHLGYEVRGWGMGENLGQVATVMPALIGRLEREHTGPVALIGWSWGGTVARALARRIPERISQVITLGTPIQGGAENTAFGSRMSAEALTRSAAAAVEREAVPLSVPALSIYTPHDGVVAWQASIDPRPGQTDHLEVNSCHVGLGVNAVVWRVIAERLGGEDDG